MFCPDCGRPYDAVDSFCRFCGRPLRSRLALVVSPRLLPQVWREARSHLWRGLTALALGAALELLRRRALRRLSASPRRRWAGAGRRLAALLDGGDGQAYEAESGILSLSRELWGYRRLRRRF